MSRLFLSLLAAFVMTLLSVSCAPPAPTLPPTLTFSPAPSSTPAPTLTPTPTETPTPTPTPEKITLTGTFGLPEEIAQKFAGAEKYITRAPDGSYQVTALGRDPQTGAIDVVDLTLLPETFSSNKDLKNPLAPATVRAKTPENLSLKPTPTIDTLESHPQKGPSEYTLIWNGSEFQVAYQFPALFEGVGSENPRLIAENLEKIPFIPIEDIQSGLAVQSLLSHILDRMDQGESLADILYMDPEATRDSWQRCGGNSLLFNLLPDGKIAKLKAKGNDQSARELRYDNATMKVLPFGANIEINGQTYFAFYIANFDPLDPANPEPDDLSNWKFFLSIPSYAGNPEDIQNNPVVNWGDTFKARAPIFPLIILYGDEKYQQNHPLLSQLLSIEGNDASRLPFNGGNEFALATNINGWIVQLDNQNRVIEVPIPQGSVLPSDTQTDIYLVEVGVAQSNP